MLWKEEVSLDARQLSDLQHACSWIDSWLQAASLQLQNSPFLGRTLEELVNEGASSKDNTMDIQSREKGKAARRDFSPPFLGRRNNGVNLPPGLPQRTSLTSPSKGLLAEEKETEVRKDLLSGPSSTHLRLSRRQNEAPSGGGSTRFPQLVDLVPLPQTDAAASGALLSLERRASSELLSLYAQSAASMEERIPLQHRWIGEISWSESRIMPELLKDQDARKIWLLDLAERARSALHRRNQDLLPAPGDAALSKKAEDRLLADQWSLSLDGPMASEGMLADMSGLSGGHQVDFGIMRQPDSGQEKFSPMEARGASSADEYGSGGTMPRSQSLPSIQPETGLQSRPRSWPWLSVRSRSAALGRLKNSDSLLDAGQKEDANSALEASTVIDPPGADRILPALLPSQMEKGQTLPVATAAARFHARQELSEADDDLSMLQAKIKRILDEEARRHGIDV